LFMMEENLLMMGTQVASALGLGCRPLRSQQLRANEKEFRRKGE